MTTDELLIRRDPEHDQVEILTLNRPEARNALTYSLYDALESAIRSSSARCIVITGTDPAFCSGDDVKSIMAGPSGPPSDRLEKTPRLDPDWHDLGKWVSSNLAELFRTEDHREGVASFLEKRPAVYRGR